MMLHLAGRNREALAQLKVALAREPRLTSANLFAGLSELDLGEPRLALLTCNVRRMRMGGSLRHCWRWLERTWPCGI